jgi:hypothetical protein
MEVQAGQLRLIHTEFINSEAAISVIGVASVAVVGFGMSRNCCTAGFVCGGLNCSQRCKRYNIACRVTRPSIYRIENKTPENPNCCVTSRGLLQIDLIL